MCYHFPVHPWCLCLHPRSSQVFLQAPHSNLREALLPTPTPTPSSHGLSLPRCLLAWLLPQHSLVSQGTMPLCHRQQCPFISGAAPVHSGMLHKGRFVWLRDVSSRPASVLGCHYAILSLGCGVGPGGICLPRCQVNSCATCWAPTSPAVSHTLFCPS